MPRVLSEEESHCFRGPLVTPRHFAIRHLAYTQLNKMYTLRSRPSSRALAFLGSEMQRWILFGKTLVPSRAVRGTYTLLPLRAAPDGSCRKPLSSNINDWISPGMWYYSALFVAGYDMLGYSR